MHRRTTRKPKPVSPAALVEHVVARILAVASDASVRVAVDGPAAADPGRLADSLIDPLLAASRRALRVSAEDYLRPASLRWERGRADPDSFYEDWYDLGALRREVLDPLGPGGSGHFLPALWNPVTDRSPRRPRCPAPPGAVLLLDGPFLLGAGLPFDLTVHLHLFPAALRRRTAAAEVWTLPAYARYQAEVSPGEIADVVVRMDDPRHPALLGAPD